MELSSFESVFITVFLCYCALIVASHCAEFVRTRSWFSRGDGATASPAAPAESPPSAD